jgi:hypothetical protein
MWGNMSSTLAGESSLAGLSLTVLFFGTSTAPPRRVAAWLGTAPSADRAVARLHAAVGRLQLALELVATRGWWRRVAVLAGVHGSPSCSSPSGCSDARLRGLDHRTTTAGPLDGRTGRRCCLHPVAGRRRRVGNLLIEAVSAVQRAVSRGSPSMLWGGWWRGFFYFTAHPSTSSTSASCPSCSSYLKRGAGLGHVPACGRGRVRSGGAPRHPALRAAARDVHPVVDPLELLRLRGQDDVAHPERDLGRAPGGLPFAAGRLRARPGERSARNRAGIREPAAVLRPLDARSGHMRGRPAPAVFYIQSAVSGAVLSLPDWGWRAQPGPRHRHCA